MNKIDAMKQALEALDGWANHGQWVWPETALEQCKRNTVEAITALRLAIEQAERQEPVAWVCEGSSSDEKHAIDYQQEDVDAIPIGTMLYTAPPQRQPLTEEELNHLWETIYDHGNGKYQGAQSRAQRERAFAIIKKIGGEHD